MIPFAFVALLLWLGPSATNPASARFEQLSKEAETARQQNRIPDALNLYKQAVALRPSWKEGWWYLGTLSYDGDRYTEGRDAFRRLVAFDDPSAAAWGLLGLCEYETHEYESSLAHLRKSLELGPAGSPRMDEVIRYHAAILLTRFEEYEAAGKILVEFAQRGDEAPSIIEALGMVALRKPLLPEETPPRERELIYGAGRAAFDAAARKPEAAQREFQDLIRRFPGEPNVHYTYGSYLLSEDPDGALQEFKRELEISPDHVPTLVTLALEYQKRGENETGLPYAARAVKVAPRSFAAHNALGSLLVETDRLDQGIKELEMAKEMAPGSPQTRIVLAKAYARAGRKEEAARERAEFLKLYNLRKKPGEQ